MIQSQIVARGITHERVLQAMARLPRERFLPSLMHDAAYDDQALPIACGQTISQPYIVAYMTAAADVQDGDKVLEVGTGTGYQTALLLLLGARVFTIERIAELSDGARRVLDSLGLDGAAFRVGDGSSGWRENAPFRRIIVTAAGPSIPVPLLEQLDVPGRLVCPVGGLDEQVMVRVDRLANRFVETPGIRCRFVKLVGSAGWKTGENTLENGVSEPNSRV